MKKWEDPNKTITVKASDDFNILDTYKEEILDTRITVSGVAEEVRKTNQGIVGRFRPEMAIPRTR